MDVDNANVDIKSSVNSVNNDIENILESSIAS